MEPLGILPPPVLSLNATTLEGNGNESGHIVIIQWAIPAEDISEVAAVLSHLILQFSPSVPECGHDCSLARDSGPLTAGQMSVTLEVGTHYEVVARAESCGGELSSPWSDPLTIHLQGTWNTTCQLRHYISLYPSVIKIEHSEAIVSTLHGLTNDSVLCIMDRSAYISACISSEKKTYQYGLFTLAPSPFLTVALVEETSRLKSLWVWCSIQILP